jgi:protein-disulfide isomerase
VLGGATKINVDNLPRIGAADNKYVVVYLYDYACWHCRELHRELLAVQAEYDGQLTVVTLPTPLSHHCNKHLTEKQSTSPDACALAKLALIVAHLAPERFAEFDAWLFVPEKARPLADARSQAAAIVGVEALAAAEQDEQYDQLIQANIALYNRSPADLIPQIMGRNVVLSAGVESASELLEALEVEFGFPRP